MTRTVSIVHTLIMSRRGTKLPSKKTLSNSNKNFNIKMSRLSTQDHQDSMLVYTEKLRSFKEARARGFAESRNDILQIRAKHIPKLSLTESRISVKKSPSIDDVTRRRAHSLNGEECDRSVLNSPRLSLPGTSSQTRGPFSDHFGYNIKHNARNEENLASEKVAEFLRSNLLPPISSMDRSEHFKKQLRVSLPAASSLAYVGNPTVKEQDRLVVNCDKRPKRAKRMKLKGSFLHDIPEHEITDSHSDVTDTNDASDSNISHLEMVPSTDLTLMNTTRNVFPSNFLEQKLSNESVNPQQVLIHLNNTTPYSQTEKPTLQDIRRYPSQKHNQKDYPSSKLKHNRKVKRLIYLRDPPDD